MTRLLRLASSEAALVRRARWGDRGATRRLAARHLERITLLANLMPPGPEGVPGYARAGFRLALRQPGPFDDALVRAFVQLAEHVPDPDEVRRCLLTLLRDVELRPDEETAALLGLPAELLAAETDARRSCRGWGLVSRRTGLTPAERQAGEAHVGLCRRCRDRLALVEHQRARLLGGSAGVVGGVGGVAVVQLVSFGGAGAAGAGGLLAGKAGAALIGTLGTAVLVTGGATAATSPTHPHRPPPVVAPAPSSSPAPAHRAPTLTRLPSAAPVAPVPRTTPPPVGPTAVPVPLPAASAPPLTTDSVEPGLRLPTLPVPLPLPTGLPLPLKLPGAVSGVLGLP
ncbi:MAG TPA: hypothetical protein VMZ11_05740 [Mycobacteriales bacterium]|nr:hypothetical protein [Mycobacteriales bacterium]